MKVGSQEKYFILSVLLKLNPQIIFLNRKGYRQQLILSYYIIICNSKYYCLYLSQLFFAKIKWLHNDKLPESGKSNYYRSISRVVMLQSRRSKLTGKFENIFENFLELEMKLLVPHVWFGEWWLVENQFCSARSNSITPQQP